MNLEDFVNWTVSIDCGPKSGTYQGQIDSIDQLNQTIRLKNAFHNGIPVQSDEHHTVSIEAKSIRDLDLLSQPSASFQIGKANSRKFQEDKEKSNALNKKIEVSHSSSIHHFDSDRSRPEKNSNQDKYRCDQMILEHNNVPIDYELIVLPTETSKKYLTDEGLIVPSISLEMRNRLFETSEYFGYSLERRIESMGRSITDMCLHLLGGTQRLLIKNRHQHPTIVVLACSNDLSGAFAICAARILATKNIRIFLYLPPEHRIEQSSIENELKLFRTTQSTLTDQVDDLPRSPVDLVLNGLDASYKCDSRLFGKPWYRSIVQYCSRLQTSIIAIDPPLDGGAIECKYSLVPVLPLQSVSNKNLGRIYLCDLAFGKEIFEHLQIRYSSPFGAKSFVALHDS